MNPKKNTAQVSPAPQITQMKLLQNLIKIFRKSGGTPLTEQDINSSKINFTVYRELLDEVNTVQDLEQWALDILRPGLCKNVTMTEIFRGTSSLLGVYMEGDADAMKRQISIQLRLLAFSLGHAPSQSEIEHADGRLPVMDEGTIISLFGNRISMYTYAGILPPEPFPAKVWTATGKLRYRKLLAHYYLHPTKLNLIDDLTFERHCLAEFGSMSKARRYLKSFFQQKHANSKEG